MAIIIWIFVQDTKKLLAPVQNQILAVLTVSYRLTEKTIFFFFTQDKFLTPWRPNIFHSNILSPFQG